MKNRYIAAAALLMMLSLTGCELTKIKPNDLPDQPAESVPAVSSEAAFSEIMTVSEAEPAESEAVYAASVFEAESVVEVPVSVAESAPEEIAVVPDDSELRVLGEAESGEYISKTNIVNQSEQKITHLAIRLRSDSYDTASYLSEEDPMLPSERRILYIDGETGIREAEQYGDIWEFKLRVVYEDGVEHWIRNFPFAATGEVSIVRGDGYSFFNYTRTEDGEAVSTENEERERLGLSPVETAAP